MNAILRKLPAVLVLLGIAGTTNAQVVIYRDCIITDVAGFGAALTSFYESITGVDKPAASLNQNIFNGADPTTHMLAEEFPDYAALEAWRDRVAESQGALLQLLTSANPIATCETEGLVVEVNSWGSREDRGDYHLVFPINTTDGETYAAAMDEIQMSDEGMDISPGPATLVANRSGVVDATHFLVQWGDSFTALNEWMDEYPQTDAFQEFLDEVSSIRTITPVVQRETIMRWNQ